jgi:hypothetical protein
MGLSGVPAVRESVSLHVSMRYIGRRQHAGSSNDWPRVRVGQLYLTRNRCCGPCQGIATRNESVSATHVVRTITAQVSGAHGAKVDPCEAPGDFRIRTGIGHFTPAGLLSEICCSVRTSTPQRRLYRNSMHVRSQNPRFLYFAPQSIEKRRSRKAMASPSK